MNLLRTLRRRKMERIEAHALAVAIVSQCGEEAPAQIRLRIGRLVQSGQDVTFECRVKREIDAMLGVPAHVDTATRYLEANRRKR